MNTTIFLAQLWGPVILAVAIGIFVSRNYYTKIYKDIEKEPLAILIFGMIGTVAAIAQILTHNVWNTLPEILISLFGWMLLIKSLAFLIAPRFVDKSSEIFYKGGFVSVAGVVMLIIGGYLTWFGFLA